MFEILCVCLLRLYPAEFRCLYGGDAAQLMRDRARDERGLTRRLRLLADLAVDLIATSVRGWPRARPSFAPIDGAPRFEIIDVRYARPETLAVALLASAVMFAAFTQLLQATALPNAPVGRQVEETRHGI